MIEERLRDRLARLAGERAWGGEKIAVKAHTLTPEEAIGAPGKDDYPLVKGRERLMEASFKGARGQAFTDMFGNFEGSLDEIVEMKLTDNFTRAVFIATLNAVMRHAGLAGCTVHCRDAEPAECARSLPDRLMKFGEVHKVALVGLQPRMLEALVQRFEVRVADRDKENIGKSRAGVTIDPPERAADNIRWCDAAVVTGTTLANGTLEDFLDTGTPTVFYGVTIAGAAEILGLERFCPLGS